MRFKFLTPLIFFLTICSGLCLIFCSEGKTDGAKPHGNSTKAVLADNGVQNQEAAGTSSAEGAPKIMFLETTFDFGTVSQGEKVTHKFVVKNIGTAPLKLIRAKGS